MSTPVPASHKITKVFANEALYQLSYTPVPGERRYRDRTETGKQKAAAKKAPPECR